MIMRIDHCLIMLLLIRTLERIMKYLERVMEVVKTGKGIKVKIEAQSKSNLGVTQFPRVVQTKNTVQYAYCQGYDP